MVKSYQQSGKKWDKVVEFFYFWKKRKKFMVQLIGTYDVKSDVKGRVLMPSALKKQFHLYEVGEFVIKRSMFQPCLEVYPMQEWRLIMAQLSKLNRFNKKNNDFIRKFTAGLRMVSLDSSGRVQLPKDLLIKAGIEKNVVLSCAVSFVEVWSQDAYENAIEDKDGSLADLAEEVMGGINFGEDELS